MATKIGKQSSIGGITKKEFLSYESVRQSGVTNMFDVHRVEEYSDLPKDKIFIIMKHYVLMATAWTDRYSKKDGTA